MILAGWGATSLVPITWTLVEDFRLAIPLLLLVSAFAPTTRSTSARRG